MKSFKQYLLERASAIIYHSTDYANEIIKSDKFRLTNIIDSKSDIELTTDDKLWFLSTTRSVTGDYTGGYATLVLDGNKLSQRYKAKAVDYFGAGLNHTDEMEDRIFHNKPYINNARKYIKELHIYISKNTLKGNKWLQERIKESNTLSKKFNIPLYVYDDINHFKLLRRNKAIDFDFDTLEKNDKEYVALDKSYYKIRVDAYLELYKKDNPNKLGKKAKQFYNQLKSDRTYLTNELRTLFSNTRTDGSANELVKVMQKLKMKTAKEFIDMLHGKWVSKKDEEKSLDMKILKWMEKIADRIEDYIELEHYSKALKYYNAFRSRYPEKEYKDTPVDDLRKEKAKEIDKLLSLGNEELATAKWEIFKKSFGDAELPYF